MADESQGQGPTPEGKGTEGRQNSPQAREEQEAEVTKAYEGAEVGSTSTAQQLGNMRAESSSAVAELVGQQTSNLDREPSFAEQESARLQAEQVEAAEKIKSGEYPGTHMNRGEGELDDQQASPEQKKEATKRRESAAEEGKKAGHEAGAK